MATCLEPSEKGGHIGNLRSNTYGENLVKIGLADLEIILFKGLILKKKLTHAMHAVG